MDEFETTLTRLLQGELPEVDALAFLANLRLETVTGEMLYRGARLLRSRMASIEYPLPLLDTCGTGGDQQCTINISTAAAFVIAATGVAVAKHGNRSVSSSSGSSDVLLALGCVADLPAEAVVRCLRHAKLGFCFAPRFHPDLRGLAPLRKKLGFPTIFNLLGPLCNPARVNLQVLGVGRRHLLRPVAEALAQLGTERAVVVHGEPGLDEVSLQGNTYVCIVEADHIEEQVWTPAELGMPVSQLEGLTCKDAAESAEHLLRILANELAPGTNWVLANAGVGLWIAGRAKSPREGVQHAAEVLRSGAAMHTLGLLRKHSQG